MRRIAASLVGIVAALSIGAAVAGCQSPGTSPSPAASPTAPAASPGRASPGASPSAVPSHVGPSPVDPGFETPAPSS